MSLGMGWKIKNKLYEGDCLEVMPTLKDKSIDLTVTSPPYDNLRTYNGNSEFDFEGIAKELFRVTKDGGVVVWIVADATVNGSETGTSFRQVIYFKEIGFNLHDTMIWNKGTFTATGALVNKYAQVFEYMFILTKGKCKTFNPIKDRVNKTYGRKHHGTIRQKDGTLKSLSNVGRLIPEYGQRFNIWEIPSELSNAKRCHPAQCSERLVTDHILSWSNESDLVLDPFAGSGTTGIVCLNTGRKFILIEKDPGYCEIIRRRLDETVKVNKRKLFL